MPEHRLGDDIDDYCVKCKRVTNHSIVSLVNEEPAKVRCRTCYNDHDFRRCEIPPTKKELKRLQLMNEALSSGGGAPGADPAEDAPEEEAVAEAPAEALDEAPPPKSKSAAKRRG